MKLDSFFLFHSFCQFVRTFGMKKEELTKHSHVSHIHKEREEQKKFKFVTIFFIIPFPLAEEKNHFSG